MRLLLLLVAVCAFVVPTSAAAAQSRPLPAPARVADDALTRALERGALSEAQYALERARSLFRLGAVRREFGDVARPDPHAATFLLRDLALRVRDLSPSEQREAQAILARPDGGGVPSGTHAWSGAERAAAESLCDPNPFCIHWTTTGNDASATEWVDEVAIALNTVWDTEIDALGYRQPKSDGSSANNGGDGRLDVYLLDLGADGLFGYCTTDDPNTTNGYSYFDFSAYCAVDNDFLDFCGDLACSPEQAEKFLKVTAAHEFFHAVQFAYDATEDIAFMEQTAMWIEDEVYDDVNDSRRYLRRSALTNPAKPIDYGAGGYEYGNWIFWRFVSHRYDRNVVRRAWQLADAASGGPDDYSIGALRRALAQRGTSLHAFLAFFGRANRRPAAYYDEGTFYPAAPLAATYRVSRTRPTGWKYPRLNHLTNRYYAFKPRRSVARKAELRVRVDLPKLKTKPLANLVVFLKSGAVKLKPIALDSAGKGGRRVPFGRAQVRRVELVLTNGSSRIDGATCWSFLTDYACGGALPRDDRGTYAFRAAIR
jgi:hypothetical protein